MKITNIYRTILSLVLLSGLFFSMQAQDQRTRETKIADIVMQLPAKNSATLDKLMSELYQLSDVVPSLATGLSDPGTSNDSQIRYAISGLAFFAAKNADTRKPVATGICKALQQSKSDEIRDFLLIQLQYVAGEESVETVKQYLASKRLCDQATRVLIRINTPAANQAMLDALPLSNDVNKISLIEALGSTRFEPALDVITKLAGIQVVKLQKVCLHALACMASPSSEDLLAVTAKKAGYVYESTDALASYILYLTNRKNNQAQDMVANAANNLLKDTKLPEQMPAKCAALKLYTESADEKKATSEIMNALENDNKSYRMAALQYAGNRYTATMSEALLKKAKKADATNKAEIIQSFQDNNDKKALPFILESLKSKDEEVVIAAIASAGKLGQEQVINPIIMAMNNKDKAVANAGHNALLSINSTNLTTEVANSIPNVSSMAKIVLLDVLAKKKDTQHKEVVFTYSIGEDKAVKEAAYKALKDVVTKDDLEKLAFQLTFPEGTNDVKAIQEALYAAVENAGNQDKQADLILDQMDKAENKSLYYKTLAMIGGQKALNTVSQGFESNDPATKTAAFQSLTSWNGFDATQKLYEISKNDPNGPYFNEALLGYISQIGKSKNGQEQKLLLLRNALEIAQTSTQKKTVLNAIAQTGTFLGLITVGNYLEDANPDVQQAAVQAVQTIALSHSEFYGKVVTDLLNKAISINKDPEAEYQKQAILKHLSSLPEDDGFLSLFNGKDLTGWKGLVENPIARGKMTSKQLKTKQEKADEIMRRDWHVENGLLVFDGKGYDNLCSTENYGDFEMYVDWKIAPKGDAGIYLRGTPQVQIWDVALTEVGAQVGSGGLYNNQKNQSTPLLVADNPVDEWNSFYIRMIGEKVTVYLNGQLVTDNITLENYWDRKLPIFPSDAIELQAHGTRVEYRDIYVRKIARTEPYKVSASEKEEGFVPLFNGTDMSGWRGNLKDYIAKDGMIVCDPTHGGRGNLYTEKEYDNFIMRFDFQLTPAANNGLGIRTPLEGDAAYMGMELQILDNTADVYKDLEEYQYHASIYGVIAAKKGYLKPLGEWNTQEVVANGNQIKITLNGNVILDGNIKEASKNFTQTLDGKEHPGLSNPSGHIGFLGHGSYVSFKNLRIKELPSKKSK